MRQAKTTPKTHKRHSREAPADWLAGVLDDIAKPGDKPGQRGPFNRKAFTQLLEMNGVKDWRKCVKGLPSDNGRLRMNGANRLRRIVRNKGALVTPRGDVRAPKSFIYT